MHRLYPPFNSLLLTTDLFPKSQSTYPNIHAHKGSLVFLSLLLPLLYLILQELHRIPPLSRFPLPPLPAAAGKMILPTSVDGYVGCFISDTKNVFHDVKHMWIWKKVFHLFVANPKIGTNVRAHASNEATAFNKTETTWISKIMKTYVSVLNQKRKCMPLFYFSPFIREHPLSRPYKIIFIYRSSQNHISVERKIKLRSNDFRNQ